MITISENAYSFLERKALFYSSRNRLPRIILIARSCQGARFAMCFDHAKDGDELINYREINILIDKSILDVYQGFELDVEQFFFAPRLLIKPIYDFRGCDCSTKCNNRGINEIS
ncbi:MAG TPA: hypothetical protein PL124_07050 [Candidatus Cloacimonadota bacterium]|nr:hypothetical protein [Candidatus Cloacimonadota bacterium]HPS39154.1 hypothetical protein [Candidatus Cloacimonadota bacterium]